MTGLILLVTGVAVGYLLGRLHGALLAEDRAAEEYATRQAAQRMSIHAPGLSSGVQLDPHRPQTKP